MILLLVTAVCDLLQLPRRVTLILHLLLRSERLTFECRQWHWHGVHTDPGTGGPIQWGNRDIGISWQHHHYYWSQCRPTRPNSIPLYPTTYSFTPCNTVLLQKLTGSQLVKKFASFYGTRMFITAFTSAATRPYPKPDKSSPRRPSHF